MNRWTAPLSVAALLAVPAVLLGWNASAIASTVTEPWTESSATAAVGASGPRVVEQGPAPSVEPRAVPEATDAATVPAPVPTRTVVVVHKTVHSTVTATQEDDVSTSDERGTDSGAPPIDSPVPATDPTPSEPAPDSDAAPVDGGAADSNQDGDPTNDNVSDGTQPRQTRPDPGNPVH